jgi:hypothetical protein
MDEHGDGLLLSNRGGVDEGVVRFVYSRMGHGGVR